MDPVWKGRDSWHGSKVLTNMYLVGGAITILKHDGVRQWEGWHPIYEMENNQTVWNHQPGIHMFQSIAKILPDIVSEPPTWITRSNSLTWQLPLILPCIHHCDVTSVAGDPWYPASPQISSDILNEMTILRRIPGTSWCQLIPVSLDWFKGKFTGNHGFYHQI